MKAIEESVKILEQGAGFKGMLEHIERVGRISYKSESKITENSYDKFVRDLFINGHWAVFNLGTVYLKVPVSDRAVIGALESTRPFTKWTSDGNFYYFTTDYRTIVQLDFFDKIEYYFVEPTSQHYHRVTVDFICSRYTANQIIRHRVFCPIQESQRYVKYSEIEYIIPQWACELNTFPGLSNVDFWENSTDPRIQLTKETWKNCEKAYFKGIELGMKRESARGLLPLDVKTELCICGYVSDFYADGVGSEKTGFFNLRAAKSAQADVRHLAEELQNLFKEKEIDKLL